MKKFIQTIYKQISILHLRWQTKILISFIYKDTLSSRGHLAISERNLLLLCWGLKIFYEENLSGLIYKQNKRRCGRKELVLSEHKLEEIRCLLAQGWSLDAIAGRDRLMNHSERVSTKILYKLLKQGIIDSNL